MIDGSKQVMESLPFAVVQDRRLLLLVPDEAHAGFLALR